MTMAEKRKVVADIKSAVADAVDNIDVSKTVAKAKKVAVATKEKVVEFKNNITPEEVIRAASQLPIAKVDRAEFLRKELIKYYPEETVKLAIEKNPAYAGIDKYKINDIANQVIKYETNKVSAISFATGLPGGPAMVASVSVDVAQYFAFILRAMQEIAYLYGFEEFDFDKDSIDANNMNEILVFLGVMFGVQSANAGVKIIAQATAQKTSKTLAQKALTKTTVYPIVKKIAKAVGINMTKQVFADSVSKIVPVIGGAVSGGLTYTTFKKCCLSLKHSFWDLSLCDTVFYEKLKNGEIDEIPEEEYIDVAESEIETILEEEENA
jgi:hypothetical protein